MSYTRNWIDKVHTALNFKLHLLKIARPGVI